MSAPPWELDYCYDFGKWIRWAKAKREACPEVSEPEGVNPAVTGNHDTPLGLRAQAAPSGSLTAARPSGSDTPGSSG